MHRLRTVPGGWHSGEEGVIEIDQSPADIVFLSGGDTELTCWVNAYKKLKSKGATPESFPSLRVANLGAFKQELTVDNYVESVVTQCRLVVARLLGGFEYHRYLVEEIQAVCEAKGIPLLWLPGYNEPDPVLFERSLGIDAGLYQDVWNGFNVGGVNNLQAVMVLLFEHCFSLKLSVEERIEIPDVFLYDPACGIVEKTTSEGWVVGLVAYRAHYLADNMAPFDCLYRALEKKGMQPVCVLAHTLRDQTSIEEVLNLLTDGGERTIRCLINTTSFSTKSIKDSFSQSGFARLDIPILQAMVASCTHETWERGDFGLPPTDIAMSVALPEVDGRVVTRPISFKAPFVRDEETESDLTRYEPHDEAIEFVSSLVRAFIKLQTLPNANKRIALILPNYPNKDARLANGVGLDTPESVVRILCAMENAGYQMGEDLPVDGLALMERLLGNVTNDQETLSLKKCEVKLDDVIFRKWLEGFSSELISKIEAKWGSPEEDAYCNDGVWLLSGIQTGNIWIAIQPSRGFNLNPAESYHSPDLPPPWNYLAFYCYLACLFEADAVVHVGKHGNLEWLPGKSLALGERSCFPAAIFPAIPHFYPFIVNDPGEGTQAKRRNQAVILDHLMPPLTRAETYGPLVELEQKIDEYYESSDIDPDRNLLLQKQILGLLEETQIRVDLGAESDDLDELLVQLDGYLCEIKEAQIRDGLHILGTVPRGNALIDTLIALHRLPTGDCLGVTQALAADKNLDLDPLNDPLELPLSEKSLTYPDARIVGDVVAGLEEEIRADLRSCLDRGILSDDKPRLASVLQKMVASTLPNLHESGKREIAALLHGLEGGFVESGPSGAPTRGRLDVLPTGRNFYSVDLRAVPTRAAWELGHRSAERIVQSYVQKHGEYPTAISLSVWGTSTMRTGGDDIAQALALMGIRPVWQGMNQRVVDFEVLPLVELGRPRVDVTLRISGFFRDAFPELIALFNAAVKKVAREEEPGTENPLRQVYLDESARWRSKGYSGEVAEKRALYRVFGSKAGSYGAGLQELISNRNWDSREDLANAYLQWGCYAYASQDSHSMVPEVFKERLIRTQIVLQNQDNREHDILDSDDYYQFHGGMANAAEVFSNETKDVFFGDHSRPENPRIKTLKEEILKVYRSRVVNPKWLRGIRRHGYKGAFEMAATVDYLFGYDATTDVVEDFVYENITKTYLLDRENRSFLEKNNPWALKDMGERMLEAIERGMWKMPLQEMVKQLEAIVLEGEGMVEDRLDKKDV